ncbi:Aorsin [Dactylellina cionopaga]|nr:Aorsin [Dactylellina cionopaga]
MPVAIGLKQSNLDDADSLLYSVSDPNSPDFGRHWSPARIQEHFAPSKETVEKVKIWLQNHGIPPEAVKQSTSKGWIHFSAKASDLEDLLQTKYYIYEHINGQSHIGCESYSVESSVKHHVDFISPSVHFDVKLGEDLDSPKQKNLKLIKKRNELVKRYRPTSHPISLKSTDRQASSISPLIGETLSYKTFRKGLKAGLKACDQFITPNCLRALYRFGQLHKANPKNNYGIVAYTPQAYVQSDLDLFFANFSKPLVGTGPKLASIDGGLVQTTNRSSGYNAESNLDLEYAMSLTYPVPVTLYQVGDIPEQANTSFNNFLDAIDGSYCTYEGGDDPDFDGTYPDPLPGGYTGPANCGTYTPTHVISTSYGYNEADLTPAYAIRQCHEYLKLGLRGVTVLYSSGDYGVAGNGNVCLDPVTGNTTDGNHGAFNPTFPSTCPYVTSVGGTQIDKGSSVHKPESVAHALRGTVAKPVNFSSGGGFSNLFATPKYQKVALAKYFHENEPTYSAQQYNNSRKTRGLPDVSANGAKYVISLEGNTTLVYGTSASTPTFGSIITILNNARLNIGKSPVGFLNPVLYEFPCVLNDITVGNNVGCGTEGFAAVPGWDPATGLGTPNYPRMEDLYLRLP